MDLRRRLVRRLHGLLLYWGLLKHPFGREYARRQYTPTGRRRVPGRGSAPGPVPGSRAAGATSLARGEADADVEPGEE